MTELAFKDRFVAEFECKFGIGVGQILEADGMYPPIKVLQLNSACALLSVSKIFDVIEPVRHCA